MKDSSGGWGRGGGGKTYVLGTAGTLQLPFSGIGVSGSAVQGAVHLREWGGGGTRVPLGPGLSVGSVLSVLPGSHLLTFSPGTG